MQITTQPACRVGWQGATLDYVVRAEGASEIVAPDNPVQGVRVLVTDTRQTDSGVEARLKVEVVDSKAY